jgi:lysozyme
MVSVVLMQHGAIWGIMFRYPTLILCSAMLVCAETFAGIANTVTTSQIEYPLDAVSPSAQGASQAAAPNAGFVKGNNPGGQSAGDTISFLKKQEGFNPKAYGDFKQTSIGYGTKALPGEKSISPQDAETRLQQEAAKVNAWINQKVKQPLTQGQRTALTSFGYNLGAGKGGLSDLLLNINAGNWQGVAKQMGAYIHSGGHINPGLIKRRDAERGLLFRSDEYQLAANGAQPIADPAGEGYAFEMFESSPLRPRIINL